MRTFVILVLAILAVNAHAALMGRKGLPIRISSDDDAPVKPPTPDAPWFCHGLDCPKYEVTDTSGDIELRNYAEGTWVSTNVTGVKYKLAVEEGFERLFQYISGENKNGVKINMTAPVKVKMIPSAGPFCENTFIVSFYVSPSFQGKPPKPTNHTVFVENVPATQYYVLGYGGFASEREIVGKAHQMIGRLSGQGYGVVTDYFFAAGYDSPFRLFGRHNEVWIEALPFPME